MYCIPWTGTEICTLSRNHPARRPSLVWPIRRRLICWHRTHGRIKWNGWSMKLVAHLSDVKGVNGKDVGASGFKVVPEVIVRNCQDHFVCVTLLPEQLHKHPGVRARPIHVASLNCYVVADIWQGMKLETSHLYKHKRYVVTRFWLIDPFVPVTGIIYTLKRRSPSPAGTNSRTICPSSSLRSSHLRKKHKGNILR